MDHAAFVDKWLRSGAAERANKDSFLIDLCDALEVPHPDPVTGDRERDRYVFEHDARLPHEDGSVTVGKIDLYKEGCFILEAKQGSSEGSKKLGTAKRETPAWQIAMLDAKGQALGYASTFDRPPPFLIVCDLGYCFDLYAAFDGSGVYHPFPSAQDKRIYFKDFAAHAPTLKQLFTDPLALDPSRHAAKVTREVATHLAALAVALEAAGHAPDRVATFLMRCLFTMFAEDVGLLPQNLFTDALKTLWIPNPAAFPDSIETLWKAMNDGTGFGFVGKLLKFNGGLFANPVALPLTREHLLLLLEAALCNWGDVEPAIFGTLLERALDAKERHALGAHYTPRAYVERLVRPTIEEPLRADWALTQAEVRQLVEAEKIEPAKKAVRAFHQKLCKTRVLDPACGSGNFLYVTLDLFKRLEGEVLALLHDLGDTQTVLDVGGATVTPAQFRGIEVKRWAKEIAELVLWIGYLQWHFRTRGKIAPPEPVLQDYGNIECRDALLEWDEKVPVLDGAGHPVTRWDGETMKPSPITGEPIPDESARVPVEKYLNPRKAEWPESDFIVGNPPYLGARHIRQSLGSEYLEALRLMNPEIPDNCDFVMYWWNKAAQEVHRNQTRRFGFITTNSISQSFSRRLIQFHLDNKEEPICIRFAIPDHPWVDDRDGADVRVAMTVCEGTHGAGILMKLAAEPVAPFVESSFESSFGQIHADLTIGIDVLSTPPLAANSQLCSVGYQLGGDGFVLSKSDAVRLTANSPPDAEFVFPLLSARDIVQSTRGLFVLDFTDLLEADLRSQHPVSYQWSLERIKPERALNPRKSYRERWWIYGETRPTFRRAAQGIARIIVTPITSKSRVFCFVPSTVHCDSTTVVIALPDAFSLGVLSSHIHEVWALRSGGKMGVGNDPRYLKARCFDPFPFPSRSGTELISLGEELDGHRKRQQAMYPDLTLTGMYNVLEKLRAGESLNAKEKVIHEQGLVSVLKQIHDELDAAVFDAYGWPHDLSDEQILERLVALNAERAAEEKRGIVRWLRPEFQNPSGARAPEPEAQATLAGTEPEAQAALAAGGQAQASWPKKVPEQIAQVRDLLSRAGAAFTTKQVAAAFSGARRAQVEAALESLAALGLIVNYDAGGERAWRPAGRASG